MGDIRFVSPVMGDVLVAGADGEVLDGRLVAEVLVAGRTGARMAIDGVTAEEVAAGLYRVRAPMAAGRNDVEARDMDADKRASIAVYWLRGAERTYRFTVDDCIRCFQDIHEHRDRYRSIFANPFLALFKRARDEYGSMVHINTFFESVNGTFNLSMMTDRFRDEFAANASWLSITFHARGEFPDAPYGRADYQTVYGDCALATREIERFAGRAVLRDTTTLHWGAANAQGVRALRDFGFRALCGYLCFDGAGVPLVSYHLDGGTVARATTREGCYDAGADMLFPKLDLVLNAPDLPAERVAPFLDALSARPHEGAFIQMVIHEQYFYPDYHHYKPDYADRVLAMARWMKEHGYRCASLSDLIQ